MRKRSRSPQARRRAPRKGPRRVKSNKPVKTFRRRLVGRALKVSLGLFVVAAGYVAWVDLRVTTAFEGKRWAVPARIYARALALYPSMAITGAELNHELKSAGYRPVGNPSRPGEFSQPAGGFEIFTREFHYWDGTEPARRLNIAIEGGRISSLRDEHGDLAIIRLDPALIGRILPTHQEDRILVGVDDVPPLLISTLLAVEDRGFFDHHGISLRGIARALLANLRAGATVQGGSTITQQLAKNFFLSQERRLSRKLNELVIALILEARYRKEEILAAYLNEIYLGQQGGRAIHGFGLASHHYFARPVAELGAGEVATLVGLARGASYYNPHRQPERSLARRNLVLTIMAEQGLLAPGVAAKAKNRPLGVSTKPSPARTFHPAFMAMVRRQLQRDYHEDDLRSVGLRVFTTLDPSVQHQAEIVLRDEVTQLEKDRGMTAGGLQGAVVVTDRNSAEVLALVGDRSVRREGFNRALDARRPVGSIIKPAVYLAALERSERYTLASLVADTPVVIEGVEGEPWSPANYDHQSHGDVPLYIALARSYNQATVNVGMAVGVEEVLDVLRRLGYERQVPAYPSVLLGAVAMTPVEVTSVYQTVASGGFKMPLRAIREVTDSDGKRLTRYGLSVRQSFQPAPVYLLNRGLEEVMLTGTGRGASTVLGQSAGVAGKTGTTDDLRDSWFAGFDNRYLSVVWLGRDNNQPTGLTGASGALKVWTELMAAVEVERLRMPVPAGVEHYWTDLETQRITDRSCPNAVALPFISGTRFGYQPCGTANQNTLAASSVTSHRE